MKLLSIDVGIRNLALCLFQVINDKCDILNWDVVNLCNEVTINCDCGKKAGYTYNKDNSKVLADQLTKHIVSVTDQMLLNLTNNKTSKEKLLNFSFNFLLERESNTSILSSFDLTVISKYFPEYTKKANDKFNV